MIVTTEWMHRNFRRFNTEYFGGKMPVPAFALSGARTQLGTMSCRKAYRRGVLHVYDFKITMTTYYDMTDKEAEDVLLHEMIHYIIAYTGLKDTSSHGVVFRGMADALNRKYGRNISIRTDTRGWALAEKYQKREDEKLKEPELIMLIKTMDGRCFASQVSPASYGRLEHEIKHIKEIEDHRWLVTDDAAYKALPKVRSLRGRRITKDDYKRMADTLAPLHPNH